MLVLVSHVQVNYRWDTITHCKTRTYGKTVTVSKVAISITSSSGKVACHSSNRSSVRWPRAWSSILDASVETYLCMLAEMLWQYISNAHLHAVAELGHNLIQSYPSVHEHSLGITESCKTRSLLIRRYICGPGQGTVAEVTNVGLIACYVFDVRVRWST
jgi:hypothetical protein